MLAHSDPLAREERGLGRCTLDANRGPDVITAVLFDFDGVLRIWDPELMREAERSAGLPEGAIPKAAFAPDLLEAVVTGRVSDAVWRSTIVERLRDAYPEADAPGAVARWSASPGRLDKDVVDLVRQCRARAKVGLLTNATSRLAEDLEALGVEDDFDAVINSSEVGAAKPDADVYRAALKALDVVPAETVFVDDTSRHVEGANVAGLRGILYDGVNALRRELHSLQVLQ